LYSHNEDSIEWMETLLEPFRYTTQTPGKHIRSLLIDAFNEWLKLPDESLAVVKDIAESLHAASLMIDDIEDGTKTRRGIQAAHMKYGTALTINAANYVYFIAADKCRRLNNPAALDFFINEMLNLHLGQGLDIYWREHCECPSIEQYKAMVSHKTGGLFRLVIGIMMSLTSGLSHDQKRSLLEVVDLLGIHYQIRDDLLNLTSEKYMKTRACYADDLTEGKFSLPIIYCILFGPTASRDKLLEILKMRTDDVQLKQEAVELIRSSGGIEYVIGELKTFEEQIRQLISTLGGNKVLTKIMDTLCVLE